jgi:flagellar biosynthesis protein FlhB
VSKRDGKTEKPTARRRKEARREGNLPRSQETSSLVGVAAALVTFTVMAPNALMVTAEELRNWLAGADPTMGLRAGALATSTVRLALAWCPPVLAAAFAGMATTIAQGGLVIAPKTARPSLNHLSWKKGLRQLSPKQALPMLAKNIAKFVVVGASMVPPMIALWQVLPKAATTQAGAAMVGDTLKSIVTRVIIGAVLVAVADQLWTRRRWMGDMMMSKQEVIDEAKRQEGDPRAKAARKRRGMELRRRRSLGAVATADVIVTNPTHFAIALKYTEGGVAPQVICKGTDAQAAKIRKEATRHGVPIIENRPLARALYRQVPLGGYVPQKFFDDVVKVLVAAYWRSGRIPGHLAARPNTVTSRPSVHGALA